MKNRNHVITLAVATSLLASVSFAGAELVELQPAESSADLVKKGVAAAEKTEAVTDAAGEAVTKGGDVVADGVKDTAVNGAKKAAETGKVAVQKSGSTVKAASEKVAESTGAATDSTKKKAEAVVEELAVEMEQPAGAVESETVEVEDIAGTLLESSDSSAHVEATTVTTVESVDGSSVTTIAEGDESDDSGYMKYIKGHLQIGTRSTYSSLVETDSGHKGGIYGSGTYLGTIYGLKEKQNYAPLHPFITYWFMDYVGVELAYDYWKAETLAMDIPYTYQEKSDGDLTVKGPTISLLGRYPNDTAFTPFGGIGLGFFSAEFDSTAAWGSSYGGIRTRVMDCDDFVGIILTGGVSWEVIKHWNLDLSAQYIGNGDVDATFRGYTYGVEDTTQPGYFPMSNWSFRLGVSYSF